ncbi:MAG: glycosyltransferase [Planctomycetales bacterium]|nr:glycosyltransferase [Planctomycetales bacterium]
MSIKFSFVTVSYNQRQYLSQAMQSILSQIDSDCEYIVMDGGSDDGSAELIRQYADSLAYWCSQPDNGPACALQDAVDRCRGEYLMYLNSDDYLLPGAVAKIRHAIDKNPGFDVYYGNGFTFDERSSRCFRTYSDRWNTLEYARGCISVFQQSSAFRLDRVREVGGFNTDNRTCWDGELLFDIAQAGGRFKRLNDFLAVFRLHASSISGGQSRQDEFYRDCARIAAKHGSASYTGPGKISSLRKAFRQPGITVAKICDAVFGKLDVTQISSVFTSQDVVEMTSDHA